MEPAYQVEIKPSTHKFLFVTLAYHLSNNGQAWPSVATLIRETGLNRKTVLDGLKALESAGLIADTGNRKGQTQGVKVYALNIPSGTDFNTAICEGSGTDFTNKRYRYCDEAVPILPTSGTDIGTQNKQGNSIEQARNQQPARAPESDPFSPSKQDQQIAERLKLNPEWEAEARKRSEGKGNPQAYFDSLIVNWESGMWASPTPKKEPAPPVAPLPPLPEIFRGCLGESIGEDTVRVYLRQAMSRLSHDGIWLKDESIKNPDHCQMAIDLARRDFMISDPRAKRSTTPTHPSTGAPQ